MRRYSPQQGPSRRPPIASGLLTHRASIRHDAFFTHELLDDGRRQANLVEAVLEIAGEGESAVLDGRNDQLVGTNPVAIAVLRAPKLDALDAGEPLLSADV